MSAGWRRAWMALGVIALAVLVIGAAIAIALVSNHGDDVAKARDDRAIEHANAACAPARPRAIEHHGSSWSQGPYWTVRCPDGSVRVISR